MDQPTIFALGSGRLPAAIAVIRISGPQARFALETISRKGIEPGRLQYRVFRDAQDQVLDRGMAVFFAGPRTETGEDSAELHLHGSRAVVSAISDALVHLGLRPAGPGEFTRQAFLNGKIDLVQAEAVADLVAAETGAQQRFALANMEGRQSRLYADWRDRLLHARAMIEAELDFSDEGDVPGSVADTIWRDMGALEGELREHLQGFSRARIINDAFEVVILGAPNAGKSSLLNALAQREAAIVSDIAGTTRDFVEVVLDLGGLKVRLVDTAGLREETGDIIERVGMDRALGRAERADLVLRLMDLAQPATGWLPDAQQPSLTVGNKIDLVSPGRIPFPCDVAVSTRTGEGVLELLRVLQDRAEKAAGSLADVLPSRLRHAEHLSRAADHLQTSVDPCPPLEVRAEELRLAAAELGGITGEIGTEDVLGAIFSSFCIGK
ncbi:MAG TPA: tRNA uridine-5-carboxymethylaminomethyl(34) synthesis GTPase MnmE [Mesorhizobium sp.]|jgi:tRNA modification GTPase|nr:tRNA uridine-5-carboxymethylaminomethyl(34) synthesis GTPase MnmE [Mesorhizobium sp.]